MLDNECVLALVINVTEVTIYINLDACCQFFADLLIDSFLVPSPLSSNSGINYFSGSGQSAQYSGEY